MALINSILLSFIPPLLGRKEKEGYTYDKIQLDNAFNNTLFL